MNFYGARVPQAALAHQPACSSLDQPHGLVQHAQLRLYRDPAVERFNVRPQVSHVKHLQHHRERTGYVLGCCPRFLTQTVDKCAAHPVDYAIRHPGGNDLTAQAMVAHRLGGTLLYGRREVMHEFALQLWSVRQVGGE